MKLNRCWPIVLILTIISACTPLRPIVYVNSPITFLEYKKLPPACKDLKNVDNPCFAHGFKVPLYYAICNDGRRVLGQECGKIGTRRWEFWGF